ncbi:MAG: hypothetical protein HDR28_08120 [Lachnospiraceae bacterium]|nr:hypothetical protein [Lachnospiraceae bacterium]
MKKKMLTVVIIIVAVVALVLVGWYIMFMNFGIGPAFPFIKVQSMDLEGMDQMMMADDSLMAAAESEEEAQEIAEQYGIELVSYENGIALYHTEEYPFDVIARGQENGYPQLSINFVRTGYDTDETP